MIFSAWVGEGANTVLMENQELLYDFRTFERMTWDFPGGPVVKTLLSCLGRVKTLPMQGFDPCSGDQDPTCHVVRPEKRIERLVFFVSSVDYLLSGESTRAGWTGRTTVQLGQGGLEPWVKARTAGNIVCTRLAGFV